MVEKVLRVTNEEGLHARPAMNFAKEAAHFKSKVSIEKGGASFDAKSTLMVLSACVEQNDSFVLRAEGEDEIQAVEKLSGIINSME